MAQLVNLEAAPIDLNSWRDHARAELVDILDSVRGKKVLVLDPKLSGPLALIAQIAVLKEHGVENLFHLSSEPLQSDCRRVVYLARPCVALMRQVAAQVKVDVQHGIQRSYSLFLVPRTTIACEKVLEMEGVHADVSIAEYPLDFIPFDEDLLSLELESSFKECHVDGDRTSLYDVARALTKLQAVFGVIPNIKGKGRSAAQVADILYRLRREQAAETPLEEASSIESLILLDRQVDMVTPLCTQLTYEGLLDEFVGISNGAVEVDPVLLGGQPSTKRQKIPLNSSDRLFRELRDLNFGAVGPLLRQKAESMKNDYGVVTSQDQSVSDLKDFVKKLNILPEMNRHTSLAQSILGHTSKAPFMTRLGMEQTLVEASSYDAAYEYVEEQVQRQEPLVRTLRLLCLLSLTHGGLPKKQFDHIRREVLHSYGFEHLFTLDNLEKAGLLRRQEVKGSWPATKRGLRLVVEDLDDSNPTDMAYVFSGYAPLSVRLVQHALAGGGWRAIEEVLKTLPGPHFERSQTVGECRQSQESAPGPAAAADSGEGHSERSLVLVVFIGGVTFAEISALRWLSSQEDVKHDFLIATTKLINGSSLLQTLVVEPSQ